MRLQWAPWFARTAEAKSHGQIHSACHPTTEEGQGHWCSGRGARRDQRHIQKMWAGASGPERRTYSTPQASRLQAVRAGDPSGTGSSQPQAECIVRTAKRLHKKGYDTSRCRAYGTIKSAGLATDSTAKSKQQKWVKCERTYSNIMRHTAWHIVEDPRMRGLNPVAYTDDILQGVTGPCHSRRPPRRTRGGGALQTICRFSVPAIICPITDPALWAGEAARSRPVPEPRPYLRTNYCALALG